MNTLFVSNHHFKFSVTFEWICIRQGKMKRFESERYYDRALTYIQFIDANKLNESSLEEKNKCTLAERE